MEKIKGYKGFNSGLICRDKKYEENTEYSEDVKPDPCLSGMHFCRQPLDVFNYYPPECGAEYAEVESTGDTAEESDKVCTNKLHIKSKISVAQLFKAHIDIVRETVKKAVSGVNTATSTKEKEHASASGYEGHASASGYEAIACTLGINGRSKASKGWIVIVDWRCDENYNWYIKEIYRSKVGKHKVKGEVIQPDTWYWFEDGELISEKS